MKEFLHNSKLQHILFWTCSYSILLYYYSIGSTPALIDHIYTLFFHIPLFTGIYTNLRLLIPKLLAHKNYWLYGVCLLLLPACMAVLHNLIFTHAIPFLAPGYYLISYIDHVYLYLFYLAYLGVGTLLYLSKSWFEVRESERKLVKAEKEKVQAELNALKNQLHPHFIFNSLNSLYALSLKKSPILPEMLLKLSEVLRYVIYDCDQYNVPLQREINFLQDYVDLQRLRTSTDRPIHFQIIGYTNDIQIAPLLFINFVENAFKHGIPYTNVHHPIQIELTIKQNQIKFQSRNPCNPDVISYPHSKGIGLKNVIKRLELRYPGQHNLVISPMRTSYIVNLTLQLK